MRLSKRTFRTVMAIFIAVAIAAAVMATVSSGAVNALAGKPDWWKQQEKVSDTIAQNMTAAVPFPIALEKDSLERRNLVARLTRFAKPDKVGYLYVMSFGKFVGYYVVKGKITSTQSQLTNTTQTWDCGHDCEQAVPSIGDDGSFGPNEGGDRGVFFFTQTGVMVETTLDWIYSDAPLHIDVPNLLAKTK
jgi:hypothetical protein